MSIRGCIFAFSAVVYLASAPVVGRAAECPIRVSAVELEGKGTSDHVFRYRVVLSANSGDVPSNAGLQIDVGSGHNPVHLLASNLQLQRDFNTFNTVLIFQRPASDVSRVEVVNTGTGILNRHCSSRSIHVGERLPDLTDWPPPSVVVILDDSNGVPSVESWSTVQSATYHRPTYKTQSQLQYPQMAKDMDLSGQARVGVRVGPGGEVQKVYIVNSSGSKSLDDAALAQVASSAYTAGVADGIPVAEDAQTIDQFTLQTVPDISQSEVLTNYCPAVLDRITLVTGLSAGAGSWYRVVLTTRQSGVDALSLAIIGARSPRRVVHWGPTDGAATGALFWPGEALAAGVVQDAAPRLKKSVACKPYAVAVRNVIDRDAIVAMAETDKPWLNAPIIESDLPARFAVMAWPKYEPTSKDPKTAIAVNVLVHVTESGVPLVAYLEGASIAPEFSAAALAAAMASTYVVPRTPDGAPLTQTFETTYVYQPAK